MSTDIKLSEIQVSEITQSGGSFGSCLGNLGEKSANKYCNSFSQRQFTWISKQFNFKCNNKFERKTSGKAAVRAGKGFTLFILNKNMNDVIKLTKSSEDPGVLIDEVAEIVTYETKK